MQRPLPLCSISALVRALCYFEESLFLCRNFQKSKP